MTDGAEESRDIPDVADERPAAWDADAYHTLSNPHVAWAQPILDRLELRGDETLIDAGCGTGRLTTQVLEQLPAGRIIAVDRDAAMLAHADAELGPRFGDRVRFVRADLLRLDTAVDEPVDRVLSTATFHWIPDHAMLFRAVFRSLRTGGLLVAQCGAGNVTHVRALAREIGDTAPFAPYLAGYAGPWFFSDEPTARRHLADAGFADIDLALIDAPVIQPDAASFAAFARSVVFGEQLARLPDDALRDRFIDELTHRHRAAHDTPPFTFDYVRLNIHARRPDSRIH